MATTAEAVAAASSGAINVEPCLENFAARGHLGTRVPVRRSPS